MFAEEDHAFTNQYVCLFGKLVYSKASGELFVFILDL